MFKATKKKGTIHLMFTQVKVLCICCVIALCCISCGADEEETTTTTVDGFVINGLIVNSSDEISPYVMVHLYICNFTATPNTLIKRETQASDADGSFKFTIITDRLTKDYEYYGNSVGYLNYILSLDGTLSLMSQADNEALVFWDADGSLSSSDQILRESSSSE